MNQTLSIEIINGTLALDEATLRAAQIVDKARVVVRENSILILPAEATAPPAGNPVAESFGLFHLPPELVRYFAEDKELEYDV